MTRLSRERTITKLKQNAQTERKQCRKKNEVQDRIHIHPPITNVRVLSIKKEKIKQNRATKYRCQIHETNKQIYRQYGLIYL